MQISRNLIFHEFFLYLFNLFNAFRILHTDYYLYLAIGILIIPILYMIETSYKKIFFFKKIVQQSTVQINWCSDL